MLPAGAAYIPCMSSRFFPPRLLLKYIRFCLFTDKGAAKIARQLGFDHAEAVVRILYQKLAAAILPHTLGTRQVSNSGKGRHTR